ncbi:GSCFA domain-containing protein, partial [Bacteroides salyersiae]
PEKLFTRRMLTVDEIVDEYTRFLKELRNQNSTLKVLFTVSPIRHIRDGMHANQLSKATLLLAIEQLQSIFPTTIFYFPSYEIMLDELRDYRFYADDMLHPSPLAVNYLWERFSDVFFSDETKKIMDECESIRKALAHRPFHPDSEEHKRFLGQIVLKIERLNRKYPYLEFE